MTTISNQNSLLDPLARTKGGCATNSNNSTQPPPRREEDDEGYDGMMPILGIKQEDEDIASVEADGTGDPQPVCDSQSRDVEKKILTAALVTSIAEAPHSVAAPQVQGDPNRRVRARLDDKPAIKSGIDHTSISYPGGGSSHVTPTTSEASSFSSVETNDHESSAASNQKINDMSRPNNSAISNPAPSISNSRTIYPRASKAAACTKVTRALRLTSGTPTSPKGKRNIDAVESKAGQPTGKLMYHQPAQSEVPNPLAAIDKTTVAFQYLQYPNLKPPAKQAAEPQPSLAKQTEGGNSYPSVAEAMSTQQPQIDNLMSSSTNELMSSQNQQQQGRGRIFSVDLDPAVLDFVESVVDPLGNSDDTPEERSRNYSVTFDDDVNSNSGRLSFRRDRSFSFEFFSFGIDGDDLLPPIDETNPSSETKKVNRIRGDSIIFDPISFHDGGIHETSALMHVKHENRDNGQANAPEASAAAPQVHQIKAPPSIIHNPPQAMLSPTTPHYAVQKGHQRVALDKPPAKAKSTSVSQPKRTKRSSQKVHVPQQQGSSKYRQITITTSSSSSRNYPQSFDDNTIHMPHGSDAAAAAAAGIAQPASANTDGFSISHTSCPMELLNKGGRIGIYLPEERKARIAKFHDKRKQRMWRKKIKYDCRKKLADSRPRIKGRFVKRSDVDTEDGA